MSENPTNPVLSVNAFCAEHGISRPYFYTLLREGKGPRIHKLGRRTLITREAAEEWRARWDILFPSPQDKQQ